VARKRENPKTNGLTPFYAILAGVAVIGVGLILYQLLGGGGTAATEPVDVQVDPSQLSQVQGIEIGDPDAPVTIYEFADFQCPACGQFAGLYAPLIKQRLVETGLARYVYYDFPLVQIHPHAFLAARGGRCANEQGGFWPYHDLVYARQVRWTAMTDPTEFFVDIAEEVGLDEGEFEECLRSDRYAEEVTRSLRLGEAMGVAGTPTLFVNMRRLPQIPSFEELEAMVRAEAGAAAGAGAGAAGDTAGLDTATAAGGAATAAGDTAGSR
jgi:protein-disulfide isomerase